MELQATKNVNEAQHIIFEKGDLLEVFNIKQGKVYELHKQEVKETLGSEYFVYDENNRVNFAPYLCCEHNLYK